jgi:hypothetical protein
MRKRQQRAGGNSILEFTLVGIPLLFLLISVFEVSRGMWLYHTLASAVREGTRFAVVHGADCNIYPSSCAVRIRTIAARIQNSATGFPASDIQNLTFTSATRTVNCPTLADCLNAGSLGDTYWPASAPGAVVDVGANRRAPVEIAASFRFQSAVAMFWPGAGRGQGFAAVILPASSREAIQY